MTKNKNTLRHPNTAMTPTTNKGAIAGPKALEDIMIPLAVARSFLGNQVESAFHEPPGKLASPIPNRTRIIIKLQDL